MRSNGSAAGLYFFEPVVPANIPAFLRLGGYGLRMAPTGPAHSRARHDPPDRSRSRPAE